MASGITLRGGLGVGLLVGFLGGAVRPAAAQFLGAWLPPERSLTVELGVSYHDNDRWFCGDFNDGGAAACAPGETGLISDTGTNRVTREESRTLSVTAKAEFAPWRWLSLKGEMPFHSARYESEGIFPVTLDGDGPGDLRLVVRAGARAGAWAYSGGYGLVFPTGDFSFNAFVMPIGQGTRNHELFAEVGRSLWPAPGYVQGGALYRIREPHEDEFGVRTDWGNEVTAYLQGGWRVSGAWWVKLESKVFKSQRVTTDLEPDFEGDFRSAWDVTPAVFHERGGAIIEAWMTIPLAGRATPADVRFGLKALYRFELARVDEETGPKP